MILFQDDEKLWDFGSSARSKDLLGRLGFSCTRSGDAYAYSNGLFRVVAANTLRYCSAGGRTGLIVEQEQENLALYSAEPENAAWVEDGGIIKVASNSCIEGQVSSQLVTTGGAIGISQVIGTFADETCLHVIAEEGTNPSFEFGLYDETAAGYVVRLRYTKATGAITVVSGAADRYSVCVINPVGPNGGKLVSLSLSTDTSGINGNSLKAFFYPGLSVGYAYFHYAQLTADIVCSSPIVTAGTAATRSADAITSSTVPSFLNKGQGSVIAEFLTANYAAVQGIFAVLGADITNSFSIAKASGSDKATLINSGVTFGSSSANPINLNTEVIMGASFATGILLSASGGVASSNTVTDGVPSFTQMSIGSLSGTSFFLNGKIFSIKFLTTAISAAGLEDITDA